LSDITNIAAQGLGGQGCGKRSLVDPKTPARRSKTSDSGFCIFEDTADNLLSGARRPASPPHVQPKARNGEQDCVLHESLQRIEEITDVDLPPIQDFADRVIEQERFWLDSEFECDGPDGFGRPQDLASILGHGTATARFEADSMECLPWGPGAEIDMSGGSHLKTMVRPSFSPSPNPKFGRLGLFEADAHLASPLELPHLDLQAMDLELDNDVEVMDNDNDERMSR
jgi:hypothetical protein